MQRFRRFVTYENLKQYTNALKDWLKKKIPTKVSSFTNDAGYLTEQDISGKANVSDLNNVAFSGDYNDLDNRPCFTDEELDSSFTDKVKKMYYSSDVLSLDLEDINYTLSPKYTYEVSFDNGPVQTLTPYIIDGGVFRLFAIGNPCAVPATTPLDETTQPSDYFFGGQVNDGHFLSLMGCNTTGDHTISITCTGQESPDFRTTYQCNTATDITFENFDITTIQPGQTYTVYVNGVAKTVHCQEASMTSNGETNLMICLGDVDSLFTPIQTLYDMMGQDIEIVYDATVDTEHDFAIILNETITYPAGGGDPVRTITGMTWFFENIGERTFSFETSENITAGVNDYSDMLSSVYPEPVLGTFTHTYTISSEYEWVRSIWVRKPSHMLIEGETYKVVLDGAPYYVEASQGTVPCINDFSGEVSQGLIIGDVNLTSIPFYIFAYKNYQTQYFGELHLADSLFNDYHIISVEHLLSQTIQQLDSKYIPSASSVSQAETGYVTGGQVYDYVNNASALAGAMHFRGSISSAQGLPVSPVSGDVYISTATFTYNNEAIEPGDIFIYTNVGWAIVQGNIDTAALESMIPQNVSDLNNDEGYISMDDIEVASDEDISGLF